MARDYNGQDRQGPFCNTPETTPRLVSHWPYHHARKVRVMPMSVCLCCAGSDSWGFGRARE
eukprot:10642063-Prorocentrum_lima.AAC.1